MISEMPGDLTAVNLQGEVAPLKRVEATEGVKTLGAMVAGDSSMKAEVAFLKDKATAFADDVKHPSPTSRTENWLAYQHTICKTMEYPMVATDISQDDWNSIFSVSNKATLPNADLLEPSEKQFCMDPRNIREWEVQWNHCTIKDSKSYAHLCIK
jgi:hypothetical protein